MWYYSKLYNEMSLTVIIVHCFCCKYTKIVNFLKYLWSYKDLFELIFSFGHIYCKRFAMYINEYNKYNECDIQNFVSRNIMKCFVHHWMYLLN